MKKHNFNSGPSILPESVLQNASKALINYDNSGLSILEIPHRSDAFLEIIQKAQNLALELLNLQNKGYYALFLHGGASSQFLSVAYNFLQDTAVYVNTGRWSNRAIKEAKLFGEVIEINKHKNINDKLLTPKKGSYLHFTSNNTVVGTQFKEIPDSSIPIICDMTSDIFSRQLDYSKFDLIYAGAQKNIGAAGTTLVIIKESLLEKTVNRAIPSIISYKEQIKNKSIFNTPPVFSIYTCMLNLQWLKDLGGISFIEKINLKKAELIYNEIDQNPLFEGTALQQDRSIMNATFTLKKPSLATNFNQLCEEAGIENLKGHRSVGGYRASMYNALPLHSVQALVDVMRELKD